jgi:hypothetical protein
MLRRARSGIWSCGVLATLHCAGTVTAASSFVRGDTNETGKLEITDAILT